MCSTEKAWTRKKPNSSASVARGYSQVWWASLCVFGCLDGSSPELSERWYAELDEEIFLKPLLRVMGHKQAQNTVSLPLPRGHIV